MNRSFANAAPGWRNRKMPRFDLKVPCKNCPFRNDETRITFACESRAWEIQESAYRYGFPCHMSAELIEDDGPFGSDQDGFVFGEKTQYCAGHIIMMLKDGWDTGWPGINNDEDLAQSLMERLDWWDAPVFGSTEDFLAANRHPETGS